MNSPTTVTFRAGMLDESAGPNKRTVFSRPNDKLSKEQQKDEGPDRSAIADNSSGERGRFFVGVNTVFTSQRFN
jgi:hypothetical protein